MPRVNPHYDHLVDKSDRIYVGSEVADQEKWKRSCRRSMLDRRRSAADPVGR